jgi:hypothetical protein
MNRLVNVLREWMELRKRLRDEREFHLDRLIANFQVLGLSNKAARRVARQRFGSRNHWRLALREIGGDWAGLIHLFSAHRVRASRSFQPSLLLATILLILLLSPDPVAVIEGVAGQPLRAADRNAVFISQQKWNSTYVGVTRSDFKAICALDGLSKVEWYQSIHARAQLKKGVTIAAIELFAQKQTSNPRLRIVPLFERCPIIMGPAKAVWAFISCCALFFVGSFKHRPRWLAYGLLVGSLHALTSLLLWAVEVQIWARIAWFTDVRALLGFLVCFATYLALLVFQYNSWWNDIRQRCPFCLHSLVLPVTEGSSDCFLLNSATTESICPHGHGVLVETRWSSKFRTQLSPFHGLIHS